MTTINPFAASMEPIREEAKAVGPHFQQPPVEHISSERSARSSSLELPRF
jgi:hypothetical protein